VGNDSYFVQDLSICEVSVLIHLKLTFRLLLYLFILYSLDFRLEACTTTRKRCRHIYSQFLRNRSDC